MIKIWRFPVKEYKLKFLHTFLFVLALLSLFVCIDINNNLTAQPNKNYIENVPTKNNHTEIGSHLPEDDLLDLDKITFENYDSSIFNNIFLSSTGSSDINDQKPVVVLDPGHGAKDPGSIGPAGAMEKNITLSVALKLGYLLQKNGINVVYTRKDDNIQWSGQKEELLERAKLSNDVKADLFISLHTNSSKIESAGGIETYYYKTSSKGKIFATTVQEELSNTLKLRDRGIRPENYSVLRNVDAPSILIELGYISNRQEEYILTDSKYQNQYALSIAKATINYVRKKD
jgi:N-acetylmuramoyl-L-alanine amidase